MLGVSFDSSRTVVTEQCESQECLSGPGSRLAFLSTRAAGSALTHFSGGKWAAVSATSTPVRSEMPYDSLGVSSSACLRRHAAFITRPCLLSGAAEDEFEACECGLSVPVACRPSQLPRACSICNRLRLYYICSPTEVSAQQHDTLQLHFKALACTQSDNWLAGFDEKISLTLPFPVWK